MATTPEEQSLQNLIQLLTQLQTKLSEVGKSGRTVENLKTALESLGKATAGDAAQKFSDQWKKAFDAIATKSGEIVTIAGKRFRTNMLAEVARTIPEIQNLINQSIKTTPTSVTGTTPPPVLPMGATAQSITASAAAATGGAQNTTQQATQAATQQVANQQAIIDRALTQFGERLKQLNISQKAIEEIIVKLKAMGFSDTVEPDIKRQRRTGAESGSISFQSTAKGGESYKFFYEKERAYAESEYQKIVQARKRKEQEEIREAQKGADERAKIAREAAELEQKIAAAKSTAGGRAAFARAQQYGFSESDLTSVRTEGSTGINILKFKQDLDGVTKNLTITTNKWGQILTDTQRRFKGFFSSIGTDFLKVVQWSAAVALVYTPMYKLQQLMGIMIENESRLAEVTVAMGGAYQDVSTIFSAVADAANKAGESINGVLEGYAQAYRATGDLTEPAQRFTTANKLMSDSLILSKLSSLDQAESIDTLAAALRQMGLPLDQGTKVLDRWVRVTKVANVDLGTLATGYAVVGDAAEAAGIKSEELAGILATIAETGIASGKEVANAGAAIIAGFQSDKGIKAIEALGVATKDYATGASRSFMEVAGDLAALRQEGLLTEDQLSKAALDIGGGPRRAKVVTTFIENYNRVLQVNQAQLEASGDAEKALAMQTQTVQTAITRLGNAFQSLGQSLGEEGGLLDTFRVIVNILGTLTKSLSDLLATVGKAGPTLAAFAVATAAFKTRPGEQQANILGRVSNFLQGPTQTALDKRLEMVTGNRPSNFFGRALSGQLTGASRLGWGAGVGLLGGALPAIGNLKEKDYKAAGANIAGGVIGGILTGGSVIGVALGSAIAEGLLNASKIKENEWRELLTVAISTKDLEKENILAPEPTDMSKIQQDVYKQIGGLPGIGKAISTIFGGLSNFAGGLIGNKQMEGVTSEGVGLAFLELTAQMAPSQEAKDAARATLDAYYAEVGKQAQVGGTESEAAKAAAQNFITANQEMIDAYTASTKKGLLEQRMNLDITSAEFNRKNEKLANLPTAVATAVPIIGQQLVDQSTTDSINNLADAYKYLFDLLMAAPDEFMAEFNSLMSGVRENAIPAGDALAFLAKQYEALQKAAKVKIEIPTVVDLADIAGADADRIFARAQELQKQQYKQMADLKLINPEDVDKLMNQWEEVFVKFRDTAKKYMGDPQFLSEAVKSFGNELQKQIDNLDITQLDITSGEVPAFMAAYQAKMAQLVSMFGELGFKEQTTPMIVELSDGTLQYMELDWRIVQGLLQKIEKNTAPEGVFNLPANADIYVPLRAKLMEPRVGGGGFEAGNVVPPEKKQRTPEMELLYQESMKAMAKGVEGLFLPNSPWTMGLNQQWLTPRGAGEVGAETKEDTTATVMGAFADSLQSLNGSSTELSTSAKSLDAASAKILEMVRIQTPPWLDEENNFRTPEQNQQFQTPNTNVGNQSWQFNTGNPLDQNAQIMATMPKVYNPAAYTLPEDLNKEVNINNKFDMSLQISTKLLIDSRPLAEALARYFANNLQLLSTARGGNLRLNVVV